MTSPQDNRIFHFPPWEPIESYRHRKRLAFDTCLKKRILTRDGNRCVECGSTKWLEIAHVEPYRVGGNNADDNLRTLCNPCHQAEGRNAVLSH